MTLSSDLFSFKVRNTGNYEVNQKLSNRLSDTLNRVKGKVDQEFTQNGILDVQEYINFRVDRKAKKMPNLNLFSEDIEKRGLTVYFVVDSSLSMKYARDNLRNITATIFKALEKCPFIDFKVIAYSGSNALGHHAKLQEINKIEDVKYIVPDDIDRLTPTDLALSYVHDKIRKSEDKKLVILFTDGLPESCNYGYDHLQHEVKKQIVKMTNDKINFFTIFYQNYEYCGSQTSDITQKMRSIFKNRMYESKDFNTLEKILQKHLIQAIERLNQN